VERIHGLTAGEGRLLCAHRGERANAGGPGGGQVRSQCGAAGQTLIAGTHPDRALTLFAGPALRIALSILCRDCAVGQSYSWARPTKVTSGELLGYVWKYSVEVELTRLSS
jgi:hypothetical protein